MRLLTDWPEVVVAALPFWPVLSSEVVVAAVLAALIPAVLSTIVALISLARTRELHLKINSRMDELLRLVGEREHARGVREERAREKAAPP